MATTKKTTKTTKAAKPVAAKATAKEVVETMDTGCACEASCCTPNDNLVLSFEKARTPVVWQFAMADLRQAAFEVSRPENENWVLTLRSGRGELRVLAEFRKEAQAKEALSFVNAALTGKLMPQGGKTKCHGFSLCRLACGFVKFILKLALLIALLISLYIGWQMTKPVFVTPQTSGQPAQTTTVSPAPTPAPAIGNTPAPTGVPLSADELLD